ncbi:hypothetical protein GF318_03855 [Candidatus Micrarchaeota archaeon]|nr:hypothetical protein [Candidatus Micrarchaeota archaeon]
MKLLNIVIILLAVMVLALGAVVGLILFAGGPEELLTETTSEPAFSVLEVGTASDQGFAVYNFRGEGEATILSLDSRPSKKLTIVDDSQAIQATRFDQLVDELRELEKYGYEVVVTNKTTINEGVYVIPTGAIPAYALFNLQQNVSDATVIYIGEKDLILSRGIKQQGWYDALHEEQRKRIVQFDGTLDDFVEQGNTSLFDTILMMNWSRTDNSTRSLEGNGITTSTVGMGDKGYLRIIYHVDDLLGVYDSPKLQLADRTINPEPESAFPWERSTLLFSLNKTNGTAFLSIKKDGKEVMRKLLRRVSDENVFLEKLQYGEPGDYIITAEDNSGVIATGYYHVKDLKIRLLSRTGITYVFGVTVDGEPVKNADAFVGVGESGEKKRFFVNDGRLTLNADLEQGLNVFKMDLYGTTISVPYQNSQENVFELYIKYLTPGLILVALVYFGARMTRRPTYKLRFGDSVSVVRQEIRVPVNRAVESFRRIRSDMNLGKTPITPQEFAISLKRYLTNGSDITEGNVEEILKNLVKSGRLENYRDYYQFPGEGDIKRNSLCRVIREKLIQSGTMFDEKNGKFVTKDCEIGFFGQNFSKKAVIVVESKKEAQHHLSSLSDAENARLRIMQANEQIEIVPIDRLEDVL